MIRTVREGRTAILAFSHGKVNAIDVELLDALESTLGQLAQDPGVGSLVLTGEARAFSAGVDLRRVIDEGPEYTERLIEALGTSLTALFDFPRPTVAAVNGAAVAGGCVIACACDRRLAAEGARIGASELLVGVAFPVAAIEILRSACGPHLEDVVLGGRLMHAAEALSVGMVHEVLAPDDLAGRAAEVAVALAAIAPDAYSLAKEQMRRPYLERIRVDGPLVNPEVAKQWCDSSTRDRIRAQVDRLSSGAGGSRR